MGMYDEIIGPLLVGTFFNTYLYGLVTYQFVTYYHAKFNDPPATRYMVLFLFILDTFHTASVMYLVWDYTVTNYGNPAALAVAPWPHTFTPLATALTAVVTQIYLGFRIWRLTNSKILCGVVILLAVPSFILGTITSIEASIIKIFSEIPRVAPVGVSWLCLQVAVDTFITVTLVIVFTRYRTGFTRTNTVLNRLIRGAVQTGLFAGLFALGLLVTFLVLPNTSFYVMFDIPIGRIYTNTLLDTLLVRDSLTAEMACRCNMTTESDTLRWAPTGPLRTSVALRSINTELDTQKSAKEV